MLLYHNKTEYSRVVEELDVTEDGIFLKDKTPDDYAGAVLTIEVVHQITLTDSSGYIEILKFDNPTPLNKDKTASTAGINIDGKVYRPGATPVREWKTKAAPNLPPEMKQKADAVKAIMDADGTLGTPI